MDAKFNNELPLEVIYRHSEEVSLLMKWKVIPLGSFHKILRKPVHKKYSYRLADNLVTNNIAVKIRTTGSNFQILIPTQEIMQKSNKYFDHSNYSYYCWVAFIASSLVDLSYFGGHQPNFLHEEEDIGFAKRSMIPDISFLGKNKKEDKHFEVGVFLSPPLSYGERFLELDFGLIFLVFRRREELDNQKKYYFEQSEWKHRRDFKKRLCLLHIDDNFRLSSEINKSYAYFQDQETTLGELFE